MRIEYIIGESSGLKRVIKVVFMVFNKTTRTAPGVRLGRLYRRDRSLYLVCLTAPDLVRVWRASITIQNRRCLVYLTLSLSSFPH